MSDGFSDDRSSSSRARRADSPIFAESDSQEYLPADLCALAQRVEVFNGKAYLCVEQLESLGIANAEELYQLVKDVVRYRSDEETLLGQFSLIEIKRMCYMVAAFGIRTVKASDVWTMLGADVSVTVVQRFITHYKRHIRHQYGLQSNAELENWMVPEYYRFFQVQNALRFWQNSDFKGFSTKEIEREKDKIS